jgi:glutathione S-transferase
MPLNQLPLLEVGDRKFIQSKAIGRFVAKKVGLIGENDLENLEIDGVVDTVDEFMLSKIFFTFLILK